MGFHNVVLPEDYSYGARGGGGFDTAIVATDSGATQRTARRSSPARTYDISYSPELRANLAPLIAFYNARLGPANTFLFKDWLDFSTASDNYSAAAADDVVIGAGDGTATVFQLKKNYTSGNETLVRTLKYPKSGTVLVEVDGVAQTETTDYTVNYTTGEITFLSAPALAEDVTAGCEFYVPVYFAKELDREFPAQLDSLDTVSIPDIPLVEDLDPAQTPEMFYHGGTKNHGTQTVASTTTISLVEGRVQVFSPSVASVVCKLPPIASLNASGGPVFYIVNDGSVDLAVNDDGDSLVVTVPAGGTLAELIISEGSSGLEWKAK
jgi:uncharacterized protein (TIGR02217 family)